MEPMEETVIAATFALASTATADAQDFRLIPSGSLLSVTAEPQSTLENVATALNELVGPMQPA